MTSTYARSSLINHSRKSSNCGDRSPRVTFKDAPEGLSELKSDPDVKMQKELLTLQTRVLELEMKLSSFTSSTTKANGNRNSHITFPSAQDISKFNSGPITSQRATLLDQSRRNISAIRASPILHQNQLESRFSPEGYSRLLMRSPSGMSTQMTNRKSTTGTRRTLKTEMSDQREFDTENFYSVTRSISSMSTRNNTSNTSKRKREKIEKTEKTEKIYDENDDEATRLHKYIKVLRREYDSDKAELIKERVKGNELAEKLRKLERKINKLDTNLTAASKVQEKYEDLIESFGQSEAMRKQQRTLIESLNNEVNVLKGEEELPRQEIGFESKSKLLVSRRSTSSKKSKSKKRTAKIF